MPNDNRPAAPAVLRNGDHAPSLLIGTPVACPPDRPGTAGIILGWTPAGEPVLLTATSRSWLADLTAAASNAYTEYRPETAPAAVTP